MRPVQFRVLIGVLGFCVLGTLILGNQSGGQQPFIPDEASTGSLDIEIVRCQLSPSPEVEVLYLGGYGGSSFYAAQYRLFGDGRLVREIVPQTKRVKPIRVDEVELAQDDLDLIVETIVRGRLAAATPENLQESLEGRRLANVEDASNMVLRVQFAACDSNAGLLEPFSAEVSIPAPTFQARRFPEVPEFQALLTVYSALEAYFPVPVAEALGDGQSRNSE